MYFQKIVKKLFLQKKRVRQDQKENLRKFFMSSKFCEFSTNSIKKLREIFHSRKNGKKHFYFNTT